MGACHKVLTMTYIDDEAFNARFRPNYDFMSFPTRGNSDEYTFMPQAGIRGPGYALPGIAGDQAYSAARSAWEGLHGTPRTVASAVPMGGMPNYVQGGSQNFYGPQVQANALAPQRRGRR